MLVESYSTTCVLIALALPHTVDSAIGAVVEGIAKGLKVVGELRQQ